MTNRAFLALLLLCGQLGCTTVVDVGSPPDAGPDVADADAGPTTPRPEPRPTTEVALEPQEWVPPTGVSRVSMARIGDARLVVYLARGGALGVLRHDGDTALPTPFLVATDVYVGPRVVAVGERFAVVWLNARMTMKVAFVDPVHGSDGVELYLEDPISGCRADLELGGREGNPFDVAARDGRLWIARGSFLVARPTTLRLCVREVSVEEGSRPTVVREAGVDIEHDSFRDVWPTIALDTLAPEPALFVAHYTTRAGARIERWRPFEPGSAPEQLGFDSPWGPGGTGLIVRLAPIAVGGAGMRALAWTEWLDGGLRTVGELKLLRLDGDSTPIDSAPIVCAGAPPVTSHYAHMYRAPLVAAVEDGLVLVPATPLRVPEGLATIPACHVRAADGVAAATTLHIGATELEQPLGLLALDASSDGRLEGALAMCPSGNDYVEPGYVSCEPNEVSLELASWDGASASSSLGAPRSELAGTDAWGDEVGLACTREACVATFARDGTLFASTFDTSRGALIDPAPVALGEPARPICSSLSDVVAPCSAADEDHVLVVWDDVRVGGRTPLGWVDHHLVARWRGPDGTWSEPTEIASERIEGRACIPEALACVVDADGRFIVASHAPRATQLRIHRGTPVDGFEEPRVIATDPRLASSPESALVLASAVDAHGLTLGVPGSPALVVRLPHGASEGIVRELTDVYSMTVGLAATESTTAALVEDVRGPRFLTLDAEGTPSERTSSIDTEPAHRSVARIAASAGAFLVSHRRSDGPGSTDGAESVLRWILPDATIVPDAIVEPDREIQRMAILHDGSVALVHRRVSTRAVPFVSELRAQIIEPPALPVD